MVDLNDQSSYFQSILKYNLLISTVALITNIPLTSWGNEMKYTEKIEKELIYSNNQNV
jgi:hypothetical protein